MGREYFDLFYINIPEPIANELVIVDCLRNLMQTYHQQGFWSNGWTDFDMWLLNRHGIMERYAYLWLEKLKFALNPCLFHGYVEIYQKVDSQNVDI